MRSLTFRFLAAAFVLASGTYTLTQAQGPSSVTIDQILKAVGAVEGSTVCEIGAGQGAMAIAASKAVGASGKVYANELTQLDPLKVRIGDSGISNITVVAGEPTKTNFPDGACDALYLHNVYHHFTEPAAINMSIAASVKPGAKVAIIDFTPPGKEAEKPEDRGKDGTHGVTPATVIREMKAAGFEEAPGATAAEPTSKNRWFIVVFAKPAQGAGGKRLFTDALPAAEFAARRAQVMAAIGDGVAIITGATEQPNYEKFKQNKQFFYLSGVEVPRAILLVDGRTKSSTLFLPARTPNDDRSEGPLLAPGDEARRLTGIEAVVDRAQFDAALKQIAADKRHIHVPFREESIGAVAVDRVRAHERATAQDPWDGRKSKEAVFREKVQGVARGSEVVDLDPVLDRLRVVKSPGEIALVREATRIAGLAILEGMRAAEAGMFEYEIEAVADYVFKRHNSMGIGYFALVATGTNAAWPHYHAAQSRLADGDLVLFDYAPEFKYYTSDVTRMFPANGTFSPRQREMYGVYVQLYQALMSSLGPGPADARLKAAHVKMTAILQTFPFTDPKIREAATRFVAGYERSRSSFGHTVGLEVHDVTAGMDGTYRPGMIFTIEPALTIPDERIYIRLEDVILITEKGYENLSGNLPMDIAGIERVMREPPVFFRVK